MSVILHVDFIKIISLFDHYLTSTGLPDYRVSFSQISNLETTFDIFYHSQSSLSFKHHVHLWKCLVNILSQAAFDSLISVFVHALLFTQIFRWVTYSFILPLPPSICPVTVKFFQAHFSHCVPVIFTVFFFTNTFI